MNKHKIFDANNALITEL